MNSTLETLMNRGKEYAEKIVAYTEQEVVDGYAWYGMRPISDQYFKEDSLAVLRTILQDKGGVTLKDLEDNGRYPKKDRSVARCFSALSRHLSEMRRKNGVRKASLYSAWMWINC